MAGSTTWRTVLMVHRALEINERELMDYVDFTTTEGFQRGIAQMTGGLDPRSSPSDFWLVLFTLLANYTSMTQTLVDHVRNLMRQFPDSDFTREEAIRRKTLGEAPITRFIKDLRNYISHETMPPMALVVSKMGSGATVLSATLQTSELLKSDRWTAGAKAYLAGTESVRIADAVAGYRTTQEAYYSWLFAERLKITGQLPVG